MTRVSLRPFARLLLPLACVAAVLAGSRAASAPDDHHLEDFIAPPGTRQARTTMLHADLATGYDRRARLDSVVYALENGARCCRVLGHDSVWVVDYSWVYPHSGLPRRWYDAEDLLRVGDSIGVSDTTHIVLTFGTYRIGVRAGSYEQARAEAARLRPREMPRALAGRLRLKLERAQEALDRGATGKPGAAKSR